MYHSDSDLLSALQKYIRRGFHNDALLVASELVSRMITNIDAQKWEGFWRRLHVIASEDIGVAQHGTHAFLQSAYEKANEYFQALSTKSELCDKDIAKCTIMYSLDTVLTLSKSPKSRLTDHAWIYFSRQEIGHIDFDNLYDYTQKKKEMELLNFITSLRRKTNKTGVNTEVLIQAIHVSLSSNMQKEFDNILRAFRKNQCNLYLMHMALLLTRPPNSTCVPHSSRDIKLELLPSLPDEFPDYVYDMHTKRGREIYHRGLQHFIEYGCVLNNCTIDDPYHKLLIKDLKRDQE